MEKQEFNKKMQETAELLGYSWEKREENYCNAGFFVGLGQVKISVTNDDYHSKDRIRFSSCYPQLFEGYFSSKSRVEVTVSENKTPERIARDIEKRFLPTYMINLAVVIKQNQREDEYETNQRATIKKVADHLGMKAVNDSDSIYLYPELKEIHRIEPCGENLVKFFCECTSEQAIEILNLFKKSG